MINIGVDGDGARIADGTGAQTEVVLLAANRKALLVEFSDALDQRLPRREAEALISGVNKVLNATDVFIANSRARHTKRSHL